MHSRLSLCSGPRRYHLQPARRLQLGLRRPDLPRLRIRQRAPHLLPPLHRPATRRAQRLGRTQLRPLYRRGAHAGRSGLRRGQEPRGGRLVLRRNRDCGAGVRGGSVRRSGKPHAAQGMCIGIYLLSLGLRVRVRG